MHSLMVPLANADQIALIDEEDEHIVLPHRWNLYTFNGKSIPIARIEGKQVRLNRLVMGCTPNDGVFISPENGDFLDCRKANLNRVESGLKPAQSWSHRRSKSVVCCPSCGARLSLAVVSADSLPDTLEKQSID